MTHFTIPMLPAAAYRTEQYGVLFESAFVYDTNRSHSPTRVVVWSNTNRPNPDRGKQLGDKLRNGNVLTKFSQAGTAERAYLDPHNVPTDDETSILISTEASVITNNGTNTGTIASGQVYSPGETLTDGDTATLIFAHADAMQVTLHLPRHNNGHGYATQN